MNLKFFICLLLIPICCSQLDTSRWVWGSRGDYLRGINSDKDKVYNGEFSGKPLFQANSNYNIPLANIKNQYEITQTTSSYNARPSEQYKSTLGNDRPIYPYRPYPDFIRPTNSLDNYPALNKYNENEYRPLGNGYRPSNGDYSYQNLRPGIGTNGRPILTGPTPSWEENPHRIYKDYDICKCVHSFNCNSPGIKFGSCDVDKQYCCYKNKQSENQGGFGKPIANIYEKPRPRPVLAGPGGPVDFQNRPHQVKEKPLFSSYENRDKELDEAYKQGLASALYEFQQRPGHYNDRYPQGDPYEIDKNSHRVSDDYKSIHSSKYGLYYSFPNLYARSRNSSIFAVDEEKN